MGRKKTKSKKTKRESKHSINKRSVNITIKQTKQEEK